MGSVPEVILDGSAGEGGGQILRTALTLSLVTGRRMQLTKVRANRSPGGLRPQHLACVRGAESISASRSEGAFVGATELSFTPGKVNPGEYVVEVGSAGSTPLLLQCLFYPLALAGGGKLTLVGGTHLPHSPVYQYLASVWQPVVEAYGLPVQLELRRAGFYPEGGGELKALVGPRREPPTRVELPARGTLADVDVSSFVSGLSFKVAERQTRAAVAALRERGIYCTAENLPLPAPRSSGSVTFVRAVFENTVAGFTALGERGQPAEQVGEEAARGLAAFMESAGALDEHLADQILLPAALLAAGLLGEASPATTRFTTARVTPHLTTNADVVMKFLPVSIDVSPDGRVEVAPRVGP